MAGACIDCCDVTVVYTDVDKQLLTLKHDADVNITVEVVPASAPIDAARIEISRSWGEEKWCTLANALEIKPFHARIAGDFKIRGVVTVCGVEHFGTSAYLRVQFPSYDEIVGDPDVKALLDAVWDETLRFNTEFVMRELGLDIRLDTTTDLYGSGPLVYGPEFRQGETPSMMLPPVEDRPEDPSPCSNGADYVVAGFHTHPPRTFEDFTGENPDEVGLPVGPSPQDHMISFRTQIPGIVYDHAPNNPDGVSLRLGTPENAPAQLYKSGNVDRRETPR